MMGGLATKPADAGVAATDRRTIFLCFVAALVEGADIVSMGLASPLVAREFGMSPGQMGLILTAAIVGLMGGAMIGGWLGDRIGRKRVLIGAFVWLGLFSLATILASDVGSFVAVRLLCGLGMGAAFPNLIAIAAEASTPERRATGVGLMFCGQPIGGTILGLFVASQSGVLDWRIIFYICGFAPLLLAPLLAFTLKESRAFERAAAINADAAGHVGHPGLATTLFGEGRGTATVLLWLSYAFTQVVVYLINNWLPTLMVAKGFSPQQAGAIAAIENIGAAAGCVLLARLADLTSVREVIVGTYAMIAASLVAMATTTGFWPVAVAGIFVGFFAIGGQLVLYTIAPAQYPTIVRATGVGAAVAVGRLGAISGPLAAGALLGAGVAPGGVLLAATPCVLIAGIAATWLLSRKA
jgi:AAHS family 3-hydroxyphenylpropionic acid transporter